MAIGDFQRALSEMTVNPGFAARVRTIGEPALAEYRLTSREQTRLVAVAQQPGMDLTCTLSRANRFGPILDVLPLTCTLLKPWLRELLDELWRVNRPDNYQLSGEEDAFAGFLQSKLASGEFSHPYLEELLDYELACWSLVRTLRLVPVAGKPPDADPSMLVHFRHDPSALLPPLQADTLPPAGLPEGLFPVRITLRGDVLVVQDEPV